MSDLNDDIYDLTRQIEREINADLPDKSGRSAMLIASYATCLVDQILPDNPENLRYIFRIATEYPRMENKLRVALPSFLRSEFGRDLLKRLRDAIDDFLESERS